jgi:bifunctional non-homologous end joining protein LigD
MVAWRVRSARAPVSFIDPCLPTVADKAPSAGGWIHEIKHDGYRLQIHKHGPRVRLFTMTGVDWTKRYPWVVQDVARLKVDRAIFDAEAVCDNEAGVTDFARLHGRCADQSVYAYAFDIMMLENEDLRQMELGARKALLFKALKRAMPGVRLSEHITGDGPTIFAHACKLELEGIVSKKITSRYQSGRSKAWVKTKNKSSPAYLRFVDGEF